MEDFLKSQSFTGTSKQEPVVDKYEVGYLEMPTDHVYGDYKYTFVQNFRIGAPYYKVKVIDKTKTEYGPILPLIDGIIVKDMRSCFSGCKSLETSPAIPTYVRDIRNCFRNCISLKTPPIIPDSVKRMGDCFMGCTFEYDYENRCAK